MVIEIDSKSYAGYFPSNPHSFISEQFIELNKSKAERVLRLVNEGEKPSVGLIAGLKNGMLKSPFSSPFGGFHFRNEILYTSEIDSFLISLKEFITSRGLHGIEIILPPDIYNPSFNAKAISSLFRNGFQMNIPEITNWVNLHQFTGMFSKSNSREYYKQAVKNGLLFNFTSELGEKMEIYDLICKNRSKSGRPIYMTLEDIMETGKLWPVDFFKVTTSSGTLIASAIFYQNHNEVCYPVFWGDNDEGRPLRAMDYLSYNLWTYYKNLGYKYIDLGISTESGIPNEGLLRFKETHEAYSSLRYKFFWQV